MTALYMDQPIDKIIDKSSNALYTQIVQQIRQWIREGRLKEGDQLPSERELAQIFDVSRVPVREALKILEFLGAVQHIKGKGVFVKKINVNQVIGNIDFLMADPIHTLFDLFEAREALEVQATYFAALRRTEEDILAIKTSLIEMERDMALGLDVTQASGNFHAAVIAAAHNVVIQKIYELLADLLSYSRQQSLRDPNHQGIALNYHKQITQKIIERDADAAMAIAKEHLSQAKDVIAKG